MKKICVYGAGVMGTDIAQVFASHGFNVVMKDMTEEICQKAVNRMKANPVSYTHLEMTLMLLKRQ